MVNEQDFQVDNEIIMFSYVRLPIKVKVFDKQSVNETENSWGNGFGEQILDAPSDIWGDGDKSEDSLGDEDWADFFNVEDSLGDGDKTEDINGFSEDNIDITGRNNIELVGIQWYDEFTCVCGYTVPNLRPYDDVKFIHGSQHSCNISDRKEVENVIVSHLGMCRALIFMECHHIYLKYEGKPFYAKFCGVPGESLLFFRMTGSYNTAGIPHLDITDRDSLLGYAKKVCSLYLDSALDTGVRRGKLRELLNI